MNLEATARLQEALTTLEGIRMDALISSKNTAIPMESRLYLAKVEIRLDGAIDNIESAKSDLAFALWRTGEVMG